MSEEPGTPAAEGASGAQGAPTARSSGSEDSPASLEVATPAGEDFPLDYSTLADVRDHLEEDESLEAQESALIRTVARARIRVANLAFDGHNTDEIDRRLSSAEALAEIGEFRSALLLVEEALVLAKVMTEHGPPPEVPDPIDELRRRLEQGLGDMLSGPELQARVQDILDRGLSVHQDQLLMGLKATIEERLEGLLVEDRFGDAAALAAASRPDGLLDRPETLARMDAVSSRNDQDLLESSRFYEEVDRIIRARIDRWLEQGLLQARLEEWAEQLIGRLLKDKMGGKEEEPEKVTVLSRSALADPKLKTMIEARIDEALAGVGAQPSTTESGRHKRADPDLIKLLGSTEFKRAFDARINQVLSYLKSDVIPKAVKASSPETSTSGYDRKFLALVKQVKALKDAIEGE